jgi:hypothetical protein
MPCQVASLSKADRPIWAPLHTQSLVPRTLCLNCLLFGPRRRRWDEMAGRLSSRHHRRARERSGGQGRTGATRSRAQGVFARARREWRGSDLDRSEHRGTTIGRSYPKLSPRGRKRPLSDRSDMLARVPGVLHFEAKGDDFAVDGNRFLGLPLARM